MTFKRVVVLCVLLAAVACRREPAPSSSSEGAQRPAAQPASEPLASTPLPRDVTRILEPYRQIASSHFSMQSSAIRISTMPTPVAEAALPEMLFSGGVLNTRLLGGNAVSAEADPRVDV